MMERGIKVGDLKNSVKIQGDRLGFALGVVDIKTKVVF